MDDVAKAIYRTAVTATPSVLIMTHSHPKETRGGAEIAALTLFQALKSRSAATWFLGCAGVRSEARLGATLTQPFRAGRLPLPSWGRVRLLQVCQSGSELSKGAR